MYIRTALPPPPRLEESSIYQSTTHTYCNAVIFVPVDQSTYTDNILKIFKQVWVFPLYYKHPLYILDIILVVLQMYKLCIILYKVLNYSTLRLHTFIPTDWF